MKYETPENKRQERQVADRIAEAKGYDLVEFGEFSACDFLAYRNGVAKALIEVRVRSKEYDTFYFAEKKRIHLLALSDLLRVPAYMAVKFPDRLTFIDISKEPDHRSFGGRNQMRCEQDKEWLVEYVIKKC